jgi:regulator of sigma E protease
MVGLPGMKPVLGDPPRDTPAAMAGLANGDTVTAIADEPTHTWTDVRWVILKEAVRRAPVAIDVETSGGAHAHRSLDLGSITKDDLDRDFLAKLGLRPFRPAVPAILGNVRAGSAGERAGLQPDDRVIAVDGKPTPTWFDFTGTIAASGGKALRLTVDRGGRQFELAATPDIVSEGNQKIGRLGVESGEPVKREFQRMTTTVRYGPIDAAVQAVRKVVDLSSFSLRMLGRMVVGDVSWKNLSGPITIADYAGQTAQLGWIAWLGFLALVSVSLGVLNLLPIPLLDGGHLVYYFAEIVKGSPVSEKTMEIGQRLGLAVLLGLTFFAFYNDINRLFTG